VVDGGHLIAMADARRTEQPQFIFDRVGPF
jgi:hypothetical protein